MDEMPENHDKKKPINHTGREGKWDKSMIEQAYLYCLEHHGTDRDLATHLGIGLRTLYVYMERYPHFLHAIKDARKKWMQNGCGNVVRSLYKMADTQIIEVPKVRSKYEVDAKGNLVEVERTVTKEVVIQMPQYRAAMAILMNRDPENWRLSPERGEAEDPAVYAEKVRQALKAARELHKPAAQEG